jgi:hypothetical protein
MKLLLAAMLAWLGVPAPAHWELTPLEGTRYRVGSVVHVAASLIAADGSPTNDCQVSPTVAVTNNAVWSRWDGSLAGLQLYELDSDCDHGLYLFQVVMPVNGTIIALTDTTNNGEQRSGALTLTAINP